MKYQTLLLALVILIAFLISPAGIKNMIVKPYASAVETMSAPVAELKTKTSSDILTQKIFPCANEEQNFKSQAILVKNLIQFPSADQTIFEINSQKRWPIASLSKLMTAVIAYEQMDLEEKITLSDKAVSTDGVSGNFKAGETFKLKDLIKAMLIMSSNDAAMALAENFGNGVQDFVNEMQKKAAELQMFSTSYLEPTGLSFINQSTASDLSKLMNYIYSKNQDILEISRQKETRILELNSKKWKTLTNINNFAGESDFIGGKTGFIDEAGHNLIALFNIGGLKILTITLGADDAFAETEKLKNMILNCN